MAAPNWKSALAALLGVSTYQTAPTYGPELGDKFVERIREALGGNLTPMPTTQTRWYLADLEQAQFQADAGNLEPAARLCRAMRRDGQISGLMGTLTKGVVALPRKFYGSEETVTALQARNGSRSVFDDMFPPSELALMADDGFKLGVFAGELLPVEGRDFPVLCRLEPEFLRYRWNENRWYYSSIAGQIPITPGDGRWILGTPGGRIAPWNAGHWPALGRSYINKEHALLHRSNYGAKLANPARAAVAPPGATEPQRVGFLARLIGWGINTVFELPPGWDVKLIESKGEGYEVFQADIDTSDKEIAVVIAGQVVTVDGGAGFSNADVHRLIRGDIIAGVAGELAYVLNTQGIPPWVVNRFGIDALESAAILEWDVKRPKDLAVEAQSMGTVADAMGKLREQLTNWGLELNVHELLTRFGIPILGDNDGDGAPEVGELEAARRIARLRTGASRIPYREAA